MPYLYQSKSICKAPSVTLTIPDEVNSNIIKLPKYQHYQFPMYSTVNVSI